MHGPHADRKAANNTNSMGQRARQTENPGRAWLTDADLLHVVLGCARNDVKVRFSNNDKRGSGTVISFYGTLLEVPLGATLYSYLPLHLFLTVSG